MALVLDGRSVARDIRARLREDIDDFVKQAGRPPAAFGVLVGEESSSIAYFRALRRSFGKLGIPLESVALPEDVPVEQFTDCLSDLNQNDQIDGIIVFQPLPSHLPTKLLSTTLDAAKDIDGATATNAGNLALGLPSLVPSTPAGGIEILRHYNIPIARSRAVVVGRSPVVGLPMAHLLITLDATVTICHSRTSDLAAETRRADIVALAAGRPGVLTADMVRPGATVIDFGVTFVDGQIVGDAAEDVASVAGAITPVPGGTGVVTNAILARNTLVAAARAAGVELESPGARF
jgi:methylenetetrahydrofolate dehydrogenase (NADP+) / methenyltetrahydrofolate cyclohydrolase